MTRKELRGGKANTPVAHAMSTCCICCACMLFRSPHDTTVGRCYWYASLLLVPIIIRRARVPAYGSTLSLHGWTPLVAVPPRCAGVLG